MCCYVWNYVVRPESLEAFRIAYGPDSEWVQLFRRDPAYVSTTLLADLHDPTRFMTLDFWTSPEACTAFRERCAAEFDALDRRFEQLTVQEVHAGDFDVI
jgi:hypothetical protein